MARIVVIGSGIAGLSTALRLAPDHDVTVVTKNRLGESNTALAQGGIAGVLFPDDSVASHVSDTLTAGAGLCEVDAVRVLCTEGPERIRELAAAGVDFDRRGAGAPSDVDSWARGLEGAHSAARIYHSGGDATGRAIVDALVAAVLAEATAGRITLRTETMLVDLVTGEAGAVTGVSVLGCGGGLEVIDADVVVLATGGAGQLFAHTTNPAGATGDGLAAALRAGAAVRDLEFFQFHPTALAGSGFLISEAVRGAGAILRDARGDRFMTDIDPRAELAPRNVVALGLHRTMAAQNGLPCHLDAREVPDVADRFPSIAGHLAARGLRLSEDLIPVTPAAHYVMGGVATDLDGRTSVPGLYAVGEVACTGVHGANRLASNSLLEGAVFAARAADAIKTRFRGHRPARTTPAVVRRSRADGSTAPPPPAPAPMSRTELQALTWAHLGLERSAEGLSALLDRLGEPGPSDTETNPVDRLGEIEGLETVNLTLIARTMAAQALARRRSVGAHVRTDAPLDFHQEAAPC